jgi:PAS domain S-box-containing protein
MFKIGRGAALGLAIATVAILANMYFTFRTTQRLVDGKTEIGKSRRILLELTETLSAVKDAETGQRGYLLTGDDSYLAPYNDANTSLDAHLRQLTALTLNNSIREVRVNHFADLIRQKLAELNKMVVLAQTGHAAEALDAVKTGVGKSLMEQIRTAAADMTATENDTLTRNMDEFDRDTQERSLSLLAISVAGLGSIGLMYLLIRRDYALNAETARQHELLAVTLRSIGDAVISTDEHGRITFMNEMAEQLTGWSLNGSRGAPVDTIFRIINETSRQPVESPVEKVLRTGTICGLANHTLLIRRDLTEVPIDDSGAPIRDARGEICGVVLVFRDFSEAKKTEGELKGLFDTATRHAAELDAIIESIPDGVLICTADGIQRVNQRTREIFGIPDDEALTGTVLDLKKRLDVRSATTGEPVPLNELPLAKALAGEAATDDHVVHRLIDGHPIVIREAAAPIMQNNEPVGAVLIFSDQTEAVQSRQALAIAKDAAEAANSAKDQFLAVLSHELRTPLAPVLAAVGMWESDPNVPETIRSDVAMLRRNIELEARLIDDLLDVTRITRGKLALNPQPVELHQLIQNVVEICQPEASGKRLHITLNLGASESHTHGDSARLQQVLWNILKNAIKFTPPGGTIAITTDLDPPITENPGATQRDIRIRVQDSGIGISPETLSRIFKAFEQGDASITRRFGGLGLGLAISKAVVDLHGGQLWAESDGESRGATFTVKLPARPAPHQTRITVPFVDPSAPTKQQRILLVEDHVDTARIMARILASHGHSVETAGNVHDALSLARRQPFTLIISDIGLPDGSGLELIQSVRERSNVPAIALSGYGMEDDVNRCMAAGFNAHLTKPIDFTKLEQTLQLLVESPV